MRFFVKFAFKGKLWQKKPSFLNVKLVGISKANG